MNNATPNLPAVTFYTPTELIGLYRSYFEKRKANDIIWLRGIYKQKPNQNRQWATAFDELRDEGTNNSITLKINWNDRNRLKDNSLVQVGGLIDISQFVNGTIQIALQVTRFDIIKDQFVTEQDIRRMELKQKKTASNYKNVNMAIGQVLFEGRRPKIAIIRAQGSRTQGDFENGLRNARTAIDIEEYEVTLTHTQNLCDTLRILDSKGYTAIAIYRGGGIDSNTDVDKPEVLEVVVSLKTPFISGVGHAPEPIFLRQIADDWTCTPQGLGQRLSEIVEDVAAKRSNSRAALVKEVEGQYKKQIEESNKKNEELLKTLEARQKSNDEQLGKLQEEQKALYKEITLLTTQRSLAQKERDSAQEKVKMLEKELVKAQTWRVATIIVVIVAIIALVAIQIFK